MSDIELAVALSALLVIALSAWRWRRIGNRWNIKR